MTIIHARLLGDKALLPRKELEKLLEFARQKEIIEVEIQDADLTTLEIMQLAEQSGAFNFWKEDGEDIYTLEDGEAV